MHTEYEIRVLEVEINISKLKVLKEVKKNEC